MPTRSTTPCDIKQCHEREREVVSRDRPLGRATRGAHAPLGLFSSSSSSSSLCLCSRLVRKRQLTARRRRRAVFVLSRSFAHERAPSRSRRRTTTTTTDAATESRSTSATTPRAARRPTFGAHSTRRRIGADPGGRFVVRRAADGDRYGADAIVKRPDDPLRLWFRSLCVKKRAGPLTRRTI